MADAKTDEPVTFPQKIEAWQCSDRKVFTHEYSAKDWQERLDKAELANQALEGGQNVGECLLLAGWLREHIPSVLFRLTKDTPLIISHWQCRDEPGYKVCKIKPSGTLYVFGYAGSWSGSYGDEVSVRDLARYAEGTLKESAHVQ